MYLKSKVLEALPTHLTNEHQLLTFLRMEEAY